MVQILQKTSWLVVKVLRIVKWNQHKKGADDDSNGMRQTPKSRKRLRNSPKWKRVKCSRRRSSGERYKSSSAKEVRTCNVTVVSLNICTYTHVYT